MKICARLSLAAVLFLPAYALAGSSSTDWSLGAGGLYSWAGGSNSLVGTNIPAFGVLGDSTPSNNLASLSIVNGLLNFTSGAFSGTSTSWSWTGGGTLNLTGCIAGVTTAKGVACNGQNNVVLIADDFTSVQIVPQISLGPLSFDAVFGNVTGTINASVAAYFGVPTAFSIGTFTSDIATLGYDGQPFVGSNISGVLKADPPNPSMPEYWGLGETAGLFLLTLMGLMPRFRLSVSRFVQNSLKS